MHYLFLFLSLLAPFGISLWGMENDSEEITVYSYWCFIIGKYDNKKVYPKIIFIPKESDSTPTIDFKDGKLTATVDGKFYLINSTIEFINRATNTHIGAFCSGKNGKKVIYQCIQHKNTQNSYKYKTSNEVTHGRTKDNGELEFFNEDNTNKQYTQQKTKSCLLVCGTNGYIALFVPTSDIPSTLQALDCKTKITENGITFNGEKIEGKFLNIKGKNFGVASGIEGSFESSLKLKLDHVNVDQQELIKLKEEIDIKNIIPSAKQQPQKTSSNHPHTPSLNKNNQNNSEQTNHSDDIPTHQSSFLAWIKTRFNHVVYGKKIKETLCSLAVGPFIHKLPNNFQLKTDHTLNINQTFNISKEVQKQTLEIYDSKEKRVIYTHTALPISENAETQNDQNSSETQNISNIYYTEKSVQKGYGNGFLTSTPREKLDYTERWIFGAIGIAVATATIYALSGKTYQYNKQI